jgi:hypothetical protein
MRRSYKITAFGILEFRSCNQLKRCWASKLDVAFMRLNNGHRIATD